MICNIYLREGNSLRLIAESEAEVWPIPNLGEQWTLRVNEEEEPCEIVDLGHPRIGLDGQTYIFGA